MSFTRRTVLQCATSLILLTGAKKMHPHRSFRRQGPENSWLSSLLPGPQTSNVFLCPRFAAARRNYHADDDQPCQNQPNTSTGTKGVQHRDQ